MPPNLKLKSTLFDWASGVLIRHSIHGNLYQYLYQQTWSAPSQHAMGKIKTRNLTNIFWWNW